MMLIGFGDVIVLSNADTCNSTYQTASQKQSKFKSSPITLEFSIIDILLINYYPDFFINPANLKELFLLWQIFQFITCWL